MRWLVVLLLLPGCAELLAVDGTSEWSWERSDSMLPNFEGEGDAFPVIVVHMHAERSKRQQEEYERNPPVCLADVGGPALPAYGPAGLQARDACSGPVADLGTGRIFTDAAHVQGAQAVAVLENPCGGSIIPVTHGFVYQTAEHPFEIEWAQDHFTVDGRMLAKGEVLKASFWIDRGDRMDQRFVRVSFDFPGYWLEANVGAPHHVYEEPPRPGRASYVGQRVLEVETSAYISSLAEAIRPLAHRMRGDDLRLSDASIAVVDGRLTELVVGLRTDHEAIRWYMASRHDDQLRVLGNDTAPIGPGVPWERAMDHFEDRLLKEFTVAGAQSVATRFIFAPTSGWDAMAGGLLQQAPVPDAGCIQCVYLLSAGLSGMDFHYAPDAVPVEVEDAPTWQVHHHQVDGGEVRGFFQAALKAS